MFDIKQTGYANRFIGKLFRKSKIEHVWNLSINEYEFQAILLESLYTDKIRFFINNHFIDVIKTTKKTKHKGLVF